MTTTPKDFVEAIGYYRSQHLHPTQDWTNLCQMIAHVSYGVPALYGSAYANWLGSDNKVVTTDLSKAPVGSLLQSKGTNPAGHIYIASLAFKNGTPGAWSNDLVTTGKIDKVARTAPATHWGHKLLGWTLEVNGYELDMTHGRPPRPIQDKRYKQVDTAVKKMERALEVAQRLHDHNDVRLLRGEIKNLKELYGKIKHA